MVYVPMLMTIQLFVIYNISNRSSYAMSFVFSSKDMFLILLVLSVRIHVQWSWLILIQSSILVIKHSGGPEYRWSSVAPMASNT